MASRPEKLIVGNKWLITLPVMLAALTAVLDASIVNVAIPNMQSSFGAGVDEIDWVITGYLISNVIIIPTTGWMSSIFGLKRYFAISQLVFVLASFLCGISWNLPSLIFFRILQGIGGGAILPVALTIMLEAFPPTEFAIASAMFGIGATLGPAIGPTLGGWLTDTLSWQWIFFVNVPIVAVSICLSELFIGENRAVLAKRRGAPIDIWGLLTVAFWLGSMQIVLQEGQKDGWFGSGFIVTLTLLSVASLVAFLIIELRIEHPLINLRIFANRNFALGSFAGAMLGAALFGAIFILPLFAGNLLHYTAFQIGLLLLPAALVSLALFPVVGRLGSWLDPRWMMAIGVALFVASLYGNGFIDTHTSNAHLVWLQILRGAALPFLFTSVGSLALTGLKPRERADGSSLFNLTRTLGGSIGIAVIATTLIDRQRFHFERFGEYVTQFALSTRSQLSRLGAGLHGHGTNPVSAPHQASAVLYGQLTQAAYVKAFDDVALGLALLFATMLLLIPLFKTPAHMRQAGPPAAIE